MSLAPDLCVHRAMSSYRKLGPGLLVFGKFVPGIASVAPPLAGVVQIGSAMFIICATMGAFLWSGAFLGAGYFFGNGSGSFLAISEDFGGYVVVVAIAGFIAWILYKIIQRKHLSAIFRMTRIEPQDAIKLVNGPGKTILVDIRSSMAREIDGRRLPGAIYFDINNLRQLERTIPKSTRLIVFCACPNEVTAAYMTQQLSQLGYQKVSPLKDGIDGWCRAGLPFEIEKGTPSFVS
jgi:rhodanese-related sulfurtransferase